MLRGSEQEQLLLKQVLRQHELPIQASARTANRQEVAKPASEMSDPSAMHQGSQVEAGQEDPDLPKYTTKLKEKCDKNGDRPVYTYTETDEVYLKHKCALALRGFTFVGKASTKRDARHEASKEACKYMHVTIR